MRVIKVTVEQVQASTNNYAGDIVVPRAQKSRALDFAKRWKMTPVKYDKGNVWSKQLKGTELSDKVLNRKTVDKHLKDSGFHIVKGSAIRVANDGSTATILDNQLYVSDSNKYFRLHLKM
jgi:hypothetical protein